MAELGQLLGGHRQVVATLLERLAALERGDVVQPRIVVLRGASGVGKTRIVRELYGRLRQRSAEPRYWPELSELSRVHESGADPMAARKDIVPAWSGFVWPAGSLPTFGWWGFNCERLAANVGENVVAAARPQLDTHLAPLSIAWRQVAGLADKVQANRERILWEVRDAAFSEAGDALFDYLESLNVLIPFSGTLAKWGWKGARAVERRTQERAALLANTQSGAAGLERQRAAGEELARIIRSVSHAGLPGIVAVEDMHLMGAELEALVNAVSAPAAGAPVLVVGTMWPEGASNAGYAAWLDDAARREVVEVVDVAPLSGDDLVAMLRWHAPNTSDHVASWIVGQLSNPHLLTLWLTLGATQRHIARHGGRIISDAASPLVLPADVEQVLVHRWLELPAATREALLWAVAANPLDDPLARFVVEIIVDVASDQATAVGIGW